MNDNCEQTAEQPFETSIKTGKAEFDTLYARVKSFLERDTLEMAIDGKVVRGYRSPDARSVWIRDYSDMMRGFKYFEKDLTSTVEHFAETQAESGRIFDYFTTFPEKLPSERENWTKYVRVPVEADVEYRFVKAAYLAWQCFGDDAWIERLLPKLERALSYIVEHPWYWDAERGLVKRPYTIDTWDFAYTAGAHEWLQFQIDERTFFGIMHGDNSGYYEAFRIMARLCDRLGRPKRAVVWERRAQRLREAMNAVCWNGRFYTHFVKLSDVTIPGVDEAEQLSLSNPMDINRGATSHEQAVAIIEEYRRRWRRTGSFAEWYSIDPPFPAGVFGDDKLVEGAYVNGGVLPLVGGELARAAFEHGFERYGVDILRRYHIMIAAEGESYLWYFPDGRAASVETSTSPDAEPTDGWGSSAMLYALIEGLAGVEDRGARFDALRLSPRWIAAGVDAAEVTVGYRCSGVSVGYTFRLEGAERIVLDVRRGSGEGGGDSAAEVKVAFHVLLPEGARAKAVSIAGSGPTTHRNVMVEQSPYADFEVSIGGPPRVEIELG